MGLFLKGKPFINFETKEIHYMLFVCRLQGRIHKPVGQPIQNQRKVPLLKHLQLRQLVNEYTVKILKIGTPEIITIIVLQLEQLDFTVQYCVQKMQTE